MQTGDELATWHDHADRFDAVAFAPRFIAGGFDGTVFVWDTKALAFSPDGNRLAIGSGESGLKRGTILLKRGQVMQAVFSGAGE